MDDLKEIYHIFQELVKTVKRRRKLSDNDMLILVIQNEELPNAISMKFNKIQDFKLGDLENVINILEYRAILIKKCKIVVQSSKIPAGQRRSYLTKDTISRKNGIITIKNNNIHLLDSAEPDIRFLVFFSDSKSCHQHQRHSLKRSSFPEFA